MRLVWYNMNKYLAELIGTFALVFCGTGAIIIDQLTGGTIGHLGVSITFGFIVTAMIYAIGPISGAHINPAVTIAFWFAGEFPAGKVLPYIIAQLIGAILASTILKFLFPTTITMGETLPWGSASQAFVLEIILTATLMFVIINVATGAKEVGIMAGLAIGITVLLEALFAGPISGASMNPARSFAPALLNGHFSQLYIYLLAPVIGAIIGVLAWIGIREK
jgi:aquaporin NIP